MLWGNKGEGFSRPFQNALTQRLGKPAESRSDSPTLWNKTTFLGIFYLPHHISDVICLSRGFLSFLCQQQLPPCVAFKITLFKTHFSTVLLTWRGSKPSNVFPALTTRCLLVSALARLACSSTQQGVSLCKYCGFPVLHGSTKAFKCLNKSNRVT